MDFIIWWCELVQIRLAFHYLEITFHGVTHANLRLDIQSN